MLSEYTCDQLHGRDASVPFWWKYLHRIRRYWHFSKFNISGAAILGFHDTWIWHASSWFSASWAVIPSLVQISRTIADNNPHFIPDVRLMTSCKLTSGSDFGDVNIYAWSFYILVPFFGKIYIFNQHWDNSILELLGKIVGPPTKAHSGWLSLVKISSWSAYYDLSNAKLKKWLSSYWKLNVYLQIYSLLTAHCNNFVHIFTFTNYVILMCLASYTVYNFL